MRKSALAYTCCERAKRHGPAPDFVHGHAVEAGDCASYSMRERRCQPSVPPKLPMVIDQRIVPPFVCGAPF
jgi:hypothetical protein